MEIIVSVTVGLLVAIGIWMLLDRGLLRVVLGIVVSCLSPMLSCRVLVTAGHPTQPKGSVIKRLRQHLLNAVCLIKTAPLLNDGLEFHHSLTPASVPLQIA